ncbi:MAG: hypothetical protein ACPH77_03580 [Pseudomonadales bacterium]
MMTDPRYPDLEVYVKTSDLDELAAMLDQILSLSPWDKSDSVYCARIDSQRGDSEVYLRPRAYKNFASIWIKKNVTPWSTDHDLALALGEKTNTEIRCSTGSWSDIESDEQALWWRIRNGISKQVQWS